MFKNAVYSNGPSNASVALDEEEIIKKIHSSYKRKAFVFTDSIFKDNSDRITYPFTPQNLEHVNDVLIKSSEEYRKVHQFLHVHDYLTVDFIAGICRKIGDSRQHKIGKVLVRLKANEELKKLFDNSSFRSGSKTSSTKLCITVSRNIVDIAMMSTHRGWRSCMNLFNGGYSDSVYNDLGSGTHIAYLHRNDDMDIKNPICRMLLKPFKRTSCFWTARILVPEPRVYGTELDGFKDFVYEWSRILFKRTYFDKSFTRIEGLYNDGSGHAFVPVDFDNSILPYVEGREEEKEIVLQNYVPEKFAIKFVNDSSYKVRYRAARLCSSTENIRMFIDDENNKIAEVVALKIDSIEDANTLINKWIKRDYDVIGRIFSNKKLPDEYKIDLFNRGDLGTTIYRFIDRLSYESMIKIRPTNPTISWVIACNIRSIEDDSMDKYLEHLSELSSNEFCNFYYTRWAMSSLSHLRKFCADRGSLLAKLLAYANSDYYDDVESTQYTGKMIPKYITQYIGDPEENGRGNNDLWGMIGSLESRVCDYMDQKYVFDNDMERYIDMHQICRKIPEKEVIIDLDTGMEVFGPWITDEEIEQKKSEKESKLRSLYARNDDVYMTEIYNGMDHDQYRNLLNDLEEILNHFNIN